MANNDPDKLIAEAKELYEQKTAKPKETEASDTLEEKQDEQVETPEPQDTVETQEQIEDTEEESESGADSELKSALSKIEKAERAMKGAQAKMTKATQEAADLRRINADLTKKVNDLQSQAAEIKTDPSVIEKLKEEYPDLAVPILNELKKTQSEIEKTKDALSKQEAAAQESRQKELETAHFQRIADAHPDVNEIASSSDWENWLEVQDAMTKEWVSSGSSNDVNTVLSRYKAETGINNQTIEPQRETLERAKQVAEPKMPKARKSQVKGDKRSWTVDDIKKMSNEDFLKNTDQILSAMEGGKIRR